MQKLADKRGKQTLLTINNVGNICREQRYASLGNIMKMRKKAISEIYDFTYTGRRKW